MFWFGDCTKIAPLFFTRDLGDAKFNKVFTGNKFYSYPGVFF